MALVCTKNFLIAAVSLSLNIYTATRLNAEELLLYHTARDQAMGKASVALPHSLSSPASLSPEKSKLLLDATYSNDFAFAAFSTYRFAVILPRQWCESRLILSRFGYSTYNETVISLNLCKQLSKHLTFGIRSGYLAINYPTLESLSGITFEGGLQATFNSHWNMALHLVNPFGCFASLHEQMPLPPSFYRVGVVFTPTSDITLSSEASYSTREKKSAVHLGLEYAPQAYLPLRIGYHTLPSTPSIGIGYLHSLFRIDAAFAWHSRLGVQSSVSLFYKM